MAKLSSILDMQALGVDKIEKSHDRKRQKVDDNNNGITYIIIISYYIIINYNFIRKKSN